MVLDEGAYALSAEKHMFVQSQVSILSYIETRLSIVTEHGWI